MFGSTVKLQRSTIPTYEWAVSAFQVEIIFQRNFRIEIRGHEVDQFCCGWMTCSFLGRFEVAHFVFQFEVHSKLFLFVVRKLAVATFEEFFGAN
jgi:hypothetical protein